MVEYSVSCFLITVIYVTHFGKTHSLFCKRFVVWMFVEWARVVTFIHVVCHVVCHVMCDVSSSIRIVLLWLFVITAFYFSTHLLDCSFLFFAALFLLLTVLFPFFAALLLFFVALFLFFAALLFT